MNRPLRPGENPRHGKVPQYGLYDGLAVQILGRWFERPPCRVCGGDGYLLDPGRACEACNGSGRERDDVAWTRIGHLAGPKAGTSEVVRSSAVDPA